MSALLDELYFQWLYSQVCSVKLKNPSRTHWKLLKILFTKEFVWFVPNDDNRVEDGKELRYEFLADNNFDDDDRDWLEVGVSILEILVGISRRAAFEDDGSCDEWFWELMQNLGLSEFNDRKAIPENQIEDVLDRVIWRTYEYDGSGGLFPLKEPEQDQRGVELWYQLSAYIMETR